MRRARFVEVDHLAAFIQIDARQSPVPICKCVDPQLPVIGRRPPDTAISGDGDVARVEDKVAEPRLVDSVGSDAAEPMTDIERP